MHPFRFAGRTFMALRDRAIYWPAHSALIVADLHLEKASWLASGGQLLPPWDSHATLSRLSTLIDQTGAAQLWALGDSFHDIAGPDRLPDDSRAMIDAMARRVAFCWIEGNHDAGADLPGKICTEMEVDGIMLRHEARADELRPEISGHFHPKVRIRTRQRTFSRPCIASTGRAMVLPAFGSFTGGLHIDDAAFRSRFSGPLHALVVTSNGLIRVD